MVSLGGGAVGVAEGTVSCTLESMTIQQFKTSTLRITFDPPVCLFPGVTGGSVGGVGDTVGGI